MKITLFVGCFITLSPLPLVAEESTGTPPGVYSFKTLSIESASAAAWGAINECRRRGFSVAVAVVDRGGITQVVLRDRFAGPHTTDTAIGKAWTANTFRQSTAVLAASLKKSEVPDQIQHVPGALLLAGGVPVEAQGELLGGIGVSGAPSSGNSDKIGFDEICARAGLDLITEAIELSE